MRGKYNAIHTPSVRNTSKAIISKLTGVYIINSV
jgi:hypothetical protein